MMAIHWTLKILLIFHPRSNLMYHYIARNSANHIVSKNQSWIKNPVKSQTKTLKNLIDSGRKTFFGDQGEMVLRAMMLHQILKQSRISLWF